jgi:hypothetical protein
MHPALLDPHIWRATFRGLRVFAFGREQILDGTHDIEIAQVALNPSVWMARFMGGDFEPFFREATAEAVMIRVDDCLIEKLTPWTCFMRQGLMPERKLTPHVVPTRGRRSA